MNFNTNQPIFLAGFIIAALAIFVLLTLFIAQNRKLRDYQHPKYGFLGKPLSVIVLAAVLSGGFFISHQVQQTQFATTTVNGNQELSLEVVATETNPSKHAYILNAIPIVDQNEWNNNDKSTFSIYWTITNSNGVFTDSEKDLTRKNPGGININLPVGTSKIKATYYVDDKTISKEISVVVE